MKSLATFKTHISTIPASNTILPQVELQEAPLRLHPSPLQQKVQE